MNRLLAFFVRTFENDRRWRRRAAAGAGVGLAIGLGTAWEGRRSISGVESVAVILGLTLLVGLGGCALATADEVRRKVRGGEHVGGAARVLFGLGAWSALIWGVVVLVVGVPLAVWVGTMTG